MADEPQQSDTIESLHDEDRTYPPPAAFTADALVADTGVYAEADADFEAFWAEQAGALLDELCACVSADFDVEHVTFQVEPRSHRAHEDLGHDHP